MSLKIFSVMFLAMAHLGLSQATSEPFFEPTVIPNCTAEEGLCELMGVAKCYNLEKQECLPYGSEDGVICSKGDTRCGSKCLTPGVGQVCLTGQRNHDVICNEGQSVCYFSNCYNEEEEDCINGRVLCPKGQVLCGHGKGSCHTPSEEVQCIKGDFNSHICQKGEKLCRGNICYNPDLEFCLAEERRVCTIGDQSCIYLYNSL